jgi:hypothetical protein
VNINFLGNPQKYTLSDHQTNEDILEELTMHKNFLKRKSTPVTINGYTM